MLLGLLCTPLVGAVYCTLAVHLFEVPGCFARFLLYLSLLTLPCLLCEFVLTVSLGAKGADSRFSWFNFLHIANFLFGPPCLANLALFPYDKEKTFDDTYRNSRKSLGVLIFTIAACILTFSMYSYSDALHRGDGVSDPEI